MRILLSIKPEYAEKILNGTKRFEYRKALPRNASVRTVVIYATMPVGKVIGEFEFGGVLCEKPKDLWRRTKNDSGITREFFDTYFHGRERAMAIAVNRPRRYGNPRNLEDVSGSRTPPQSFQYLAEPGLEKTVDACAASRMRPRII
jgi:predicted transcriptional regulator